MTNPRLLTAILGVLIFVSAGCGHVLYADGPYQGKVIDKETKQPIEGAAVVAVWWKQSPSVGHYVVTYHDAQETLTDQQGNFTIQGIVGGSVNPLAKIREPVFTIFKPGYATYGGWVFKPRSVSGDIEIFEKDGLRVFALGRLATREERLENLGKLHIPTCLPEEVQQPASCVPDEKTPNLIRLKKTEDRELAREKSSTFRRVR